MKALTVKQPWAALIISGVKNVENRSWATAHRGELAIHSSLKPAPEEEWGRAEHLCRQQAPPWGPDQGMITAFFAIVRDPRQNGVVLGTVELVDVTHVTNPWAEPGMRHWILESPFQFAEPVPARGALQLWDWRH